MTVGFIWTLIHVSLREYKCSPVGHWVSKYAPIKWQHNTHVVYASSLPQSDGLDHTNDNDE